MTDIVTLKAICDELKLDPRERLRTAASYAKGNPEIAKARKSRTPWRWVKGSSAEKEALKVLAVRAKMPEKQTKEKTVVEFHPEVTHLGA